MSTKRTEILVRRIRRETNNEDYSDNSGIRQTTIVGYLNDSIDFVEEGLNGNRSDFFEANDTLDIVAGQDTYLLSSDVMSGGGIKQVQALFSGSNGDYFDIDKKPINKHSSTANDSNQVTSYHIAGNKLIVHPIPTVNKTAGIKYWYTKQLNRLDVRRGTVDVATLDGGSSTITLLSVDIATLLSTEAHEYDEHDHICIVDSDGAYKMKNIPITALNTTTGDITVGAGFTYAAGETIAVGDYVVFGKNTSTHQLDLDPNIERLLVAYAKWEVQSEDSNNDANFTLGKLRSIRDSILAAYGEPDDDITYVPEGC